MEQEHLLPGELRKPMRNPNMYDSFRRLWVEPPDYISSALFSIKCFSVHLCSCYACDVFCVFIVIQLRSSLSISSVVINMQSKMRDDVIFMDAVSKRSKLTFLQKIAQVISSHFFQDFVSDFINSFYSSHVAVAACAKELYLFLHHFCCCRPVFSVVEDD